MADPQRQDSLTDQMTDVLRYAVESGCYDAHDWLVDVWGQRQDTAAPPVQPPTHPGVGA